MPKVQKRIRAPALQQQVVVSNDNNNNKHTTTTTNHHSIPLGQVIDNDHQQYTKVMNHTKTYNNKKMKQSHHHHDDDDAFNPNIELDSKMSQKIINLSKEQQFEILQEEEQEQVDKVIPIKNTLSLLQQQQNTKKQQQLNPMDSDDSNDDDDDDDTTTNNNDIDQEYKVIHDDEGYVTIDTSDMMMELGVSNDEERIVQQMMMHQPTQPSQQQRTKTLADIISEKIHEKEQQQQLQLQQDTSSSKNNNINQPPPIPQKVIDVYTDIGKILSRYTSGKLPKAFKVIPSLYNWMDIVYITNPEYWTPQAMYMATRIFASNCNPKMATLFYHDILLMAIRNDIHIHKKLNYHYYMSLKKCIYKPQSFFQGIVLPLCNDPNTTIREAIIIASIIQRISIPVHHSAVVLHKLSKQTEYSHTTCIIMKTLLNKKYSLPLPVINHLIQYFLNFIHSHTTTSTSTTKLHDTPLLLPVLWHQTLLIFIQRYKNVILTPNENDTIRNQMKVLFKQQYHTKITPEIRRELFGLQAYHEERYHNTTTTIDDRSTSMIIE